MFFSSSWEVNKADLMQVDGNPCSKEQVNSLDSDTTNKLKKLAEVALSSEKGNEEAKSLSSQGVAIAFAIGIDKAGLQLYLPGKKVLAMGASEMEQKHSSQFQLMQSVRSIVSQKFGFNLPKVDLYYKSEINQGEARWVSSLRKTKLDQDTYIHGVLYAKDSEVPFILLSKNSVQMVRISEEEARERFIEGAPVYGPGARLLGSV